MFTSEIVRSYDLIGFGDEVPGILTLVCAVREYQRRTGRRLRSLLMFKSSSQSGVGGHLVRGKLAYLDRSNVPLAIRNRLGLPTFGDASAIYKEFLQRSGVYQIALDPQKADRALRQMLGEAGVDILSQIEIDSVIKDGETIAGIKLTKGETYLAKQFIDSTVNAELAQAAGVNKHPGFGVLGLPEAELPATLVFETEGLSAQRLQQVEFEYLKRFTNPNDTLAQSWLNAAAGGEPVLAEQLRKTLKDAQGKLKTMWIGRDYIDIRSKALSIAYHAYRNKKLSLVESGAILDNGNVAILASGRLSWNALLCHLDAAQAEERARKKAIPTFDMLTEMKFVESWFKSLGATAVQPAIELYIRHAGNVMGAVEPLSGAQMLKGGVPDSEALGTFGYPFDVRGGIKGLDERSSTKGFGVIDSIQPPLFNIGIRHALLKTVPNLAVVSPASGFDGFACSTGRIVEFNVAVGQGLGIAAAIAISSGRPLASISNREVRDVLVLTGKLPRLYHATYAQAADRLKSIEQSLIDSALA